MTVTPASNLQLLSQFWDSATLSVWATVTWNFGTSTAGEVRNLSYLDNTTVVTNFNNWDCGNYQNKCNDVPLDHNTLQFRDLTPNTTYYWRVNERWHVGLNDVWFPSAIQSFTTVPASSDPNAFPTSVLGPPPHLADAAVSVLGFPPHLTEAITSVLPQQTGPEGGGGSGGGGGGGVPPPPIINGNVETIVWGHTGLPGSHTARTGDALALVLAVMYCESSGNPSACGGEATPGETHNCSPGVAHPLPCSAVASGLAWWFGLFQLNVDCTAQGFGMTLAQLNDANTNSNVGVPPIMHGIGLYGSTTQYDYTDTQIAQMMQAAGHPGVLLNLTAALNDPLIKNVTYQYNSIKGRVRNTDYPS